MKKATTPRAIGRPLNKTDLKRLAGDFIDEATATAAGLRRVNSQEGSQITLMKDNGSYAGIVFPYTWPGETDSHLIRLRRDTPDVEIGAKGERKELRKYIAPPGSRNALYFPPIDPGQLTNAALPLVVTEGEKKVLALWRVATHSSSAPRFLPIGISGVANWRGTIGRTTDANGRPQAEKGPIPDWHRMTLEGRQIVLLFDRDAATNPKVRFARYQLAQYLTKQKARVAIAEIPASSEKNGIDEYTAAKGPALTQKLLDAAAPADIPTELNALAAAAAGLEDTALLDILGRLLAPLDSLNYAVHRSSIRKLFPGRVGLGDLDRIIQARREEYDKLKRQPKKDQPLTYKGETYEATETGMVLWRSGRFNGEGFQPIYLCNFSARIIADVIRDDGEEKTRALKIAATVNDQAAELIVTAADFSKMDWPIENLGAAAIVYPGFRDHARCAIQQLSKDIPRHTSYTHVGWNHDGGRPIYLHAGGAISAAGFVPGLHIDLDKRLTRYALPEPPANGIRKEAIRASLQMLSTAPDTITIPLLGAVFRACIGNVRCSVFLAGQTGSGKSELAALAQQFYGPSMTASNLPASWESTPNALEAMAHKAKDALLTIDDFVPKGSSSDLARLHQTADRILRAQGNNSGRARMTADATLRAPKTPRGMVLATGEDLPKGHSLRARLVVLEVQPGDVQWRVLTECQRAAAKGTYAAALAAFIQHIAGQLDAMREKIEGVTVRMREHLSASGHKRTPDNIASLAAALDAYLCFAVEVEAITAEEYERLSDRCGEALETITASQDKAQEHGEPCSSFIESIASAISAGAAHLADAEGGSAGIEYPTAWGWRKDPADQTLMRPQGSRIGWIVDDDVYLEPMATYKAAQVQQTSGDALTLSLNTLKRRLKQRDMLKTVDDARESVTVRRTLEHRRRDVLHFHATPSLLSEKNPTNPTSVTNATGTQPAGGNWSGFSGRENGAFKATRPVPDHGKANGINSSAQLVGLVGFSVEPRDPQSVQKETAGKRWSGAGRVDSKTVKNPTTKTRPIAANEEEL